MASRKWARAAIAAIRLNAMCSMLENLGITGFEVQYINRRKDWFLYLTDKKLPEHIRNTKMLICPEVSYKAMKHAMEEQQTQLVDIKSVEFH